MKKQEFTLELAGKKITAIISDLAMQAGGSVILTSDETVVLATACISNDVKDNKGFFNLTVEYMEKFYASGMIGGGQYNKREGRPSDKAVLSSRVIDRTIRPLFPHHIKNAVQVIITVLAVGKADPTILGVNAASLAIALSPIPWDGPVGCVQISRAFGASELLINDYHGASSESSPEVDITVCGKDGLINMIEAMTYEISEDVVSQAFTLAIEAINRLQMWQQEIVSHVGKEKLVAPKPALPDEIKTMFEEIIQPQLGTIFTVGRNKNISVLERAWKGALEEKFPEDTLVQSIGQDYFETEIDSEVHRALLSENKRVDGRALDEVRELYAEAGGVSPVLHGSGIFYRGETHILSVLTLGGPDDATQIEGMEIRGAKRFMHHYNFPPFSTGETGRVGGLNRREMGHGFLAEKALTPVIPAKELFPYTIRLVSETLSSNGSSSQGSICAGSLALMDGGVPIKAPVAGIAMGVMLGNSEEVIGDSTISNQKLSTTNYKLLTDIQGAEDHYGDMDFKIAGSRTGVTALQLDVKVGGIPITILSEALIAAKNARLKILDAMDQAISAPRANISPNAPKIVLVKIKVDQIGLVIGGGGKTVKEIREKTGAEITIEDDGSVYIVGKGDSADHAKKIIESLVKEYKVGDIVNATIIKLMDFGAFAALEGGGTEGLIHISEIAPFRVERSSDYLHEGNIVPVQIIRAENGKLSLSIKAIKPDLFKPRQ